MKEKKRYAALDVLRGVAIIAMVLYHGLWDLVYVFDVRIPWFYSDSASVIQLSIRWTFILLSGFCWSMGSKKIKRSLIVLACSVIITAVTAVFTPENTILFGVLSLIGTGMLLTIPLDKLCRKLSPYIGLAVCIALFVVTENTVYGRFSIGDCVLWELPDVLYANTFTAYFGFRPVFFSSPDYVPLLPWLFSFWMGYFLYRIFKKHDLLKYLSVFSFKPLEWIGRHSLIIYMLHQPIVYGLLFLIFEKGLWIF